MVMHGGGDKVVLVDGAQDLYNRAASTDKTLRIIPGASHELCNEPQYRSILDEIHAWMQARL